MTLIMRANHSVVYLLVPHSHFDLIINVFVEVLVTLVNCLLPLRYDLVVMYFFVL